MGKGKHTLISKPLKVGELSSRPSRDESRLTKIRACVNWDNLPELSRITMMNERKLRLA
jgi:hypothetical protein